MLSHYRLVEKIGEGGMGVVWKARDEVLNRFVAIKLLAADASLDESRRRMFLEEARLASSLSHAHIVQVYEFGREDDLDFIVMELIEGQPLQRIMRGRPLPSRQVAEYGRQVALAVARAHRQGLLHRDLKPGNILLSTDGEVKVVDFGLAILFERSDMTLEFTGQSQATTRELLRPEERRIAGTLPYMSPEQVRGERLDSRSDIFSLGVILYEMTTGSLPFQGATFGLVAAEIQKAQPRPVHKIIAQVPFELDRTIQKALSARPSERYQTMDDVAVDLHRLSRELESGSSRAYADLARPPARRAARAWLLAAGLASAALLVIAAIFQSHARDDRITAPLHRQVTFTGGARNAEISPDGQFVAYVQSRGGDGEGLMVQDLSGGQPLEIMQAKRLLRLRWPPGGGEMLACREDGLYRVPRLGGVPRQVRRLCPYFSWSPDGERVAAAAVTYGPIGVVQIETGQVSELSLEKEFTFLHGIDWSPRGHFIAFLTVDEQGQDTIWTIPAAGGAQAKILTETARIEAVRWSGDGRSLYYIAHGANMPELRRIEVDLDTGRAASAVATVLTGLPISSISFSREGNKLAYTREAREANLWIVTPGKSWQAGDIEKRRLTSGTYDDQSPVVSPDGRDVCFVRKGDLYIVAVAGGPERQLTFTKGDEWSPAWSPDGRWIAFGSNEGGTARVWRIEAEGGTPRSFDRTQPDDQIVWSPGARILYQRTGRRNFHLLDPETGEETPLVKDQSVGWIFNPFYSADGKRVVVWWNRRHPDGKGGLGYWAISPIDSKEVYLGRDAPVLAKGDTTSMLHPPLGWLADGAWLFSAKGGRYLRIPAAGGEAETVFEWPFEEGMQGVCTPLSSNGRWLCTAGLSRSDIWLVEHLDAEAL